VSDNAIETAAMLNAIAWCVFGFGGLAVCVWFVCDEVIYRLRARCSDGSLSSENLRRALERKL
jgi:hypothetical protein